MLLLGSPRVTLSQVAAFAEHIYIIQDKPFNPSHQNDSPVNSPLC